MSGGLPAISGVKLMKLLEADGWQFLRESTHGKAYTKVINGTPRVATIPNKRKSLPQGTLLGILGSKQTGLGRKWLKESLGKS